MTGEVTPPPPPDRSLIYAVAGSLVLLVLAVSAGAGASRALRPAPPSPSPTPTPFVRVSPTEPPDTGPLVFTQPLSAGCAAGDAVYVVSDGGGIGRFEFDRWQLIDPIARSLVAATCHGDILTAVGGGGRVITIDDRAQTVSSDSIGFEDFLGVAPLADGILVVGRSGLVQRQSGGGWGAYATGIDEDLYAVAAFSPTSAWAVGAGGVSYRLEPVGWRPVATGATATLRAIAARAVDDAVVVGDDATILLWNGAWTRADAPVRVGFRAALQVGDGTYIAGDQGTLLRLSGGPAAPALIRIDLGTTCTLRGLFSRGTEVWVVGSDGGRAAVWRVGAAGSITGWGACP
ncbi:MAG TPA: hypothetical protein DCK98_00380 [Chloroflexi bacterium]|nr:hypothetical protein [Chloroflexota bacterium]HAL27947.1 hypothetical protein [Chloroflexota bacterium]